MTLVPLLLSISFFRKKKNAFTCHMSVEIFTWLTSYYMSLNIIYYLLLYIDYMHQYFKCALFKFTIYLLSERLYIKYVIENY